MSATLYNELVARGLVQDVTDRDELAALLEGGPTTAYAGYDPTATSLHIGHLVPTVLLARLQRAGHRPIALVGGATGMIGDPSGKSDERTLLDAETLAENVTKIRGQLEPFLDFEGANAALMVNNADWFTPISFIEFLRDVGKHLTVNYMAAKESVRSRLSDRDQGISYTEFSYMLLQGYDFVELAAAHGCRLQVGGSDQWGNITAGIELARKMGRPEKLFGLVSPLLLDASGAKMGKTSSGTRIWLDPEKTSPYAFYQYWLNIADDDVVPMLRRFSWRSLEDIAELAAVVASAPHRREGQRALAEDMVRWVHGAEALRRAEAASDVMFGGSLAELCDADLLPLLADVPSSELPRAELEGGISLVELLATTGLASSRGAARRLLQGGGVYLNNVRISEERSLTLRDLGTESLLLLRAGKKSYHILRTR